MSKTSGVQPNENRFVKFNNMPKISSNYKPLDKNSIEMQRQVSREVPRVSEFGVDKQVDVTYEVNHEKHLPRTFKNTPVFEHYLPRKQQAKGEEVDDANTGLQG